MARCPKGNAGPCCSSVPLGRGVGSGVVLGVPFFHCAGFNMAITPDETALIAEYERLRHELDELDARTRQLDRKLIDIEKLLPDHYVYPGDPAPNQ